MKKRNKIIISCLIIIMGSVIMIVGAIVLEKKPTSKKKSEPLEEEKFRLDNKEEVENYINTQYAEEGYEFQFVKQEGDEVIFNKIKIGDPSDILKYTVNLKTQELFIGGGDIQ